MVWTACRITLYEQVDHDVIWGLVSAFSASSCNFPNLLNLVSSVEVKKDFVGLKYDMLAQRKAWVSQSLHVEESKEND